jgi:hypothetical protein
MVMTFPFFRNGMRALAVAAACAILAACNGAVAGTNIPSNAQPGTPSTGALPPIKHVWVIILENQTYNNTFGTTLPVPYLSQTVAAQGELLQNYYGTSHFSLGNYISLLSGQAVTTSTQDDCSLSTYPSLSSTYGNVTPASVQSYNQIQGTGCIYPANTLTIADQLTASGYTWKGYMEDMGNDPTREAATCGQPTGYGEPYSAGGSPAGSATGVGAYDNTQSAQVPPSYKAGGTGKVSDQYAGRHNPFIYFQSMIQSPSGLTPGGSPCATHVVPLNSSTLQADVASISTTPNFSFITPNLCDDGHDVPCHTPGSPTGAQAYYPENAFLQKWVPIITHSPAFQQDGLLIITFDETSLSGTSPTNVYVGYDGSGCCNEPTGPNTTTPGIAPLALPQYYNLPITTGSNGISGGGQIGTVLVSPYVKPGSVSTVGYNHYYMLHQLEDFFGINNYLGFAGYPGTTDFGTDVWTSTTTKYTIDL